MRLAVHDDRAVLLRGDGKIDVAEASAGRFGPDAAALYADWSDFRAWAEGLPADTPTVSIPDTARIGAPSPAPRQVFGIGVNYADHAAEAHMELPEAPLVFAKFPGCVAGQDAPLVIDTPTTDWEVELVVVIGTRAVHAAREDAWAHVAGVTVGQDISDRALQMQGASPQFSLGKSRAGYGPIGPALVTIDELGDPDDLEISCTLGGEEVQSSRTSNLIHGVPELIAYLSGILPLLPGDLVFTGTPSGVGFSRTPPRYLSPGDELVSTIEGIGSLVTTAAAEPTG